MRSYVCLAALLVACSPPPAPAAAPPPPIATTSTAPVPGAAASPSAASPPLPEAPPPPPALPPAVADLQRALLASHAAADAVASLTTDVGARLAGSPGDKLAVAWALEAMKSRGLSNVRAEKV